MQRRDSEHTGQRMLNVELPGRRKIGGLIDVAKEDMQEVGVIEEDA